MDGLANDVNPSSELTGLLYGIVAAIAGGVVWAIRLEGAVKLQTRLLEDHIGEEYRGVLAHLDRIDRKLEQLSVNCVANQHIRPDRLHGLGPAIHRRVDDESDPDRES